MRYHYKKTSIYLSKYEETYNCNHPVYNVCTLFNIGSKGIAIVQQWIDKETKLTWLRDIDPCLTDEIYLHSGFKKFFDYRAGEDTDGLYPTVTIRQIMWALKMKPLAKERWETCFDRKNI